MWDEPARVRGILKFCALVENPQQLKWEFMRYILYGLGRRNCEAHSNKLKMHYYRSITSVSWTICYITHFIITPLMICFCRAGPKIRIWEAAR